MFAAMDHEEKLLYSKFSGGQSSSPRPGMFHTPEKVKPAHQ
jgi:hypothetical protein